MTTLYRAYRPAFGMAALALFASGCAWNEHRALLRTAPGEEMAFDRLPTSVERPTNVAMPALAPCQLAAHGPDIVCALVTMDDAYYASMRSRGGPNTNMAQDAAHDPHDSSAAQVATDD